MSHKAKIIVSFCFIAVILTGVSIYSIVRTTDYRRSAEWVTHTHIVITSAETILEQTREIETLQLKYVVSGDKKYLELYADRVKKIEYTYLTLKALIKDNAGQIVLLDTIHESIKSRIAFADTVISTRKNKGFEASTQLMAGGIGESRMNTIVELIDTFKKNEDTLRSTRAKKVEDSFSSVIFVAVLIRALIVVVLFIGLYFYLREYNKRIVSEKDLKENTERFYKIFDKSPVAMAITNIDTGKLEYVNETFLSKLGYTKDEVIGKTSLEVNLVPSEDRERTVIAMQQQGYVKDDERFVTKKNGEKICVLLSLETVVINNKKTIITTLHDIQQRKEMEEQIRSLLEFQNIILNGTDYSILTTSATTGLITSFNRGAEQMLGYRAGEVIGMASPALINDANEVKRAAQAIAKELNLKEGLTDQEIVRLKVRLDDNVTRFNTVYIHKNGSRIKVELSLSALRDKENNVIGYLNVAKNITELKRVEEALVKAKEEAEQANLLKENFLANMSHEIRTPMNAIIGFTDILLKRNLQEQEKDYVRTIKSSGESLLQIINDILDISKINSGVIVFDEHPISIKEVFRSMHAMLLQKANEKKLNLSFDYDHNLPDTVLGDSTRLSQILINLVGNAIKFTKEGSVAVYAKVLKEEKKLYQIEISVKDTGIGIPEDKLQYIFERFRQAESHTARNYGGTGLGLSISKQLTELQGGTMTVKSTVGSGSVFSFTLPFKKTSKTYLATSRQSNGFNIEGLSNFNILLVEDNPVNIKFVSSLFLEYNLYADIAENGKQAIDMIKSKEYDIILMDIEMPEMNGYKATSIIRNDLKSDVPIIAMTANGMAGEKEKCLQAGMNDYISKPIHAELLFEKIHALISLNAKKQVGDIEKNKIINIDFLIRTMHEKKDIIKETIDIVLEQMPEDIADINDAILKTNYEKIRRSAHKMKSTVSIMSMTSIQRILEEMETLGAAAREIEKIKTLNNSLNLLTEKATQELKNEQLNYT